MKRTILIIVLILSLVACRKDPEVELRDIMTKNFNAMMNGGEPSDVDGERIRALSQEIGQERTKAIIGEVTAEQFKTTLKRMRDNPQLEMGISAGQIAKENQKAK